MTPMPNGSAKPLQADVARALRFLHALSTDPETYRYLVQSGADVTIMATFKLVSDELDAVPTPQPGGKAA